MAKGGDKSETGRGETDGRGREGRGLTWGALLLAVVLGVLEGKAFKVLGQFHGGRTKGRVLLGV